VQRVEAAPWVRRQSSSMAVTQAIFGINVAVFIAMSLAGVSITDPTVLELRHWGANFGPLTIGGEWWRLLTCVFVHIGIIHIALNMWCLWGLGRLAEAVYDHWTFGAVYLITGVSASVASLVWNPVGTSAGASGAIFGIAGALISSFYLGEFSMPRSAVSGLLRSVVTFAGYNLVFGAMSGRTDNAAHVGGLVSGLILGALIAKVAPAHDQPLRRVGVLVVGVVIALGGALWLYQTSAYALHTASGERMLSEKKTDQAIVELQAALKQRPNYLPAHFELARAYAIKNDFAKAAAEFRRVVELDPRDPNGWYFLGYAELEQKHPEQARQAFNQLLKVNPNSADAHFGLAAVASFENKYSEALAEYQKTALINPHYQNVDYDTGLMQGKLGRYDDAIQSFLKQRDNGDDPDNENALAEAYQNKGMAKEAADAQGRASQFENQK